VSRREALSVARLRELVCLPPRPSPEPEREAAVLWLRYGAAPRQTGRQAAQSLDLPLATVRSYEARALRRLRRARAVTRGAIDPHSRLGHALWGACLPGSPWHAEAEP